VAKNTFCIEKKRGSIPFGHGLITLIVLFGIVLIPEILQAQVTYVTPWTILINTNNIVVVTNAVGDGVFTNTTAIQTAITAAKAGERVNGLIGGTVELPGPGVYLCGPVTLANNVNLQVDAGAILRMLPYGSYPGGIVNPQALISGSSLTNIEISGSGAIDGQGAPWWPGYKTNSRPVMVSLNSCKFILIQNITLSNSPEFHIAIGGSSANTTIQNITIRAPSSEANPPSHNTDADDVSGTNILVQNCNISTGDDDFTCGGGTADILITNNTYGTGHGISIGSYTDKGGVSNMTVINCTMSGTDNGIRIKSDNDRGGLVQNIFYCNIGMTNVDFPIQAYAYYNETGTPNTVTPTTAATQTNAAVTSLTPIYRNITFSNINATAVNGYPAVILWPRREMPGTNFVFNRVHISANQPVEIYNANNVQFIDSQFNLSGATTYELFNAQYVVSNSVPTNTLQTITGLSTNGFVNALGLFNGNASFSNTNVFANGTLSLGSCTLTANSSISLAPNVLNFTLGTNTTLLAVAGNLTLGGTDNITAGPGFTNGIYKLMTYTGSLSGTVPTLGIVPAGYTYAFDTSTGGQVNLVVTSPDNTSLALAPANLTATPSDTLVTLSWSASATATNYNVKRSLVTGGSYTTIATVATTGYSDTQVTNGTTYYYVVSSLNNIGEGTNSFEVSATPQAVTVAPATTNVFNDTFAASTINSNSPAAPAQTSTSYELTSSKSWNPSPTIAAGHLKFGIAATTSGVIEAQALFTNSPVALINIGDSMSLVVTFTNTSGLLTESSAMGFGLYNSGQNYPVPGGLNSTATTSSTANAIGNAQTWVGYVGQLSFTGGNSQIMTRPMQTIGTVSNNDQDVVSSGSPSSSYIYPAGSTVGTASSAPSLTLVTGSPYTEVLTVTLTAANTLAITNTLYGGTSASGTPLSQFGGIASGSTYLTNSFDALSIGWRATANTSATTIDINQIAVNTGAIVDTIAPPSAPTDLQAAATNLLINLQWNAVSGASTYNLKRGTASGGSYPTIYGGLTTTNYADTNVTDAVPYYYIVTAVGAGGESSNSAEATAAPLPSNQPSNVVFQVSGNQLMLSWPANQLGWELQEQTNIPGAGLGTNWVTVANSTNITSTNILIDPTQGNVFYRLVYP
jgi:polygalacturonase/fibronectin type 3 domain-containing protein